MTVESVKSSATVDAWVTTTGEFLYKFSQYSVNNSNFFSICVFILNLQIFWLSYSKQNWKKTFIQKFKLQLFYHLRHRWYNRHVRGASKIKLKRVNKMRTVTVRRVIIFFEYLKASIADLFTLLSSSVQNSEGGGDGEGGDNFADPCQDFKQGFLGGF